MTIRERAEKKYEKRRQLQRGPRSPARVAGPSTPSCKPPASSQTPKSSTESLSSPASVISTVSLNPDREALLEGAVAAYLSQWTNTNVNIWWSVFDAAAIFSSGMTPDGSFGLALKAVSLMALAQQPEAQSFDLLRSARRQYGQALKALNEVLKDSTQYLNDQTFMTLILTAAFEVLRTYAKRHGDADVHNRT